MPAMSDPIEQARPEKDRLRSSLPWVARVLVVAVVVVIAAYWWDTRLPDRITIAGGPADGRYDQLAHGLASELRNRLGIQVEVQSTHGSLDNLHQLESEQASLGLYQSETRAVLEDVLRERQTLRFVANLYPEYLIPVVAPDSKLELTALNGHKIACNDHMSGDRAMLMMLLKHLSQDPEGYTTVPYTDLPTALDSGDVDAAVISCGINARVLHHLLAEGHAVLIDIPFLNSFVRRNAALVESTIPAGYFTMTPQPIPADDYRTVATQAQLLATEDVSVRLVETATEIILDPHFQRRLQLADLNSRGAEYAQLRPEFPVHVGASHIYNPALKPLLDPDFVEGTEGIRSFLVSIIAAIWLTHRWWKRRELLSQEHRLDRYIKDVLQIERDQIGIDGTEPSDETALQELLDRVTHLRQAALSEFTAHELNEDQAVDCFVEMCHALSDKISGKLIRHTMKHQLSNAVVEQLKRSESAT